MMKKPKIKKDPANLSLPSWVKATSEKRAAEKGLSLSDLVSRLLEKWIADEEANPGRNEPPPIPRA